MADDTALARDIHVIAHIDLERRDGAPAIATNLGVVDMYAGTAAPRHCGTFLQATAAELAAFPEAVTVMPKTRRRGAAYRKRWKDQSGAIYEWDSQHGTVEKYDAQGRHLGEYDPDTGEKLKPAHPGRRVEP